MLEGIEKVYLAGPMSGKLDYNFPVFNAMAKRLREAGYVVINPAETAGGASHLERQWYFRFDFAVITCVDAVFLMDGWDESPGAMKEALYADEIGLPLYRLYMKGSKVRIKHIYITGVEVSWGYPMPSSTPYEDNAYV